MMEESVTGGCSDSEQTRAMITSLWFISENVAGNTIAEISISIENNYFGGDCSILLEFLQFLDML